MACIDKYPNTTSDEYKKCIQESGELTAEQQGIKDEYFKAIKITEDDEKDIIKDLKSKKQQTFKSAKFKKQGFGTMAGGPTMVKRSKAELEELLGADYNLYEQYIQAEDQDDFFNNIKLKEEDISAARSSRIKMKSRTYMESVDDPYFKSIFGDGDKNAILASFGEDYEKGRKKIDTANFLVEKANENAENAINVITGKEEEVLKDGKKITKTYGGIDNELRLMKESLDLARKNGKEPALAFFEKYNELLTERDEAVVDAEDAIKKIEIAANNQIEAVGNLKKPMQGVNAFKRNYSNIASLTTGIQRAGLSFDTAGVEVAEFATVYGKAAKNFIKGDFGQMLKGLAEYETRDSGSKSSDATINMLRNYREGLLDAKEYLNYKQTNYLPETIDLDDINSISDFARYSGDAILNNLPQLTMSLAGPYIGTALFIASGTGEKAAEVGLQERELAKIDIEKLKNKLNTTTDPFEKMFIQSEIEKYDKVMNMSQTTKFLGALGHGLAEGVFERAFGSIRIIEGMADAWKFIPKESVGKSLLRTASYLPTTAGMESFSEGATQITQNLFDRYLFKDDVSIFQDLDESMVQGFIIGKGFALVKGAPNMYGAILNASQTKNDKQLLKGKAQELNSILKNLHDPQQAKNLTADGRRQLEIKAGKLQKDIINSADTSLDKLSNLSVDQIFQVGDIDRQMNSINKQYVQAVQSGMSEKSLNIIKKDLQTEFSTLQNKKADILDAKIDESTLEDKMQEDLKTTKKIKETFNLREDIIKGQKILGDNLIIIDKNTDTSNLTQEELKSPGFHKDNKIYINPALALDVDGNVNVVAHEILHKALDAYAVTPEGITAIESFYNGLDQQTKNAIDNELKSRDYGIPQDSKNVIQDLKDGDYRIDEILTQYLDLVESKDSNIDIKKGTLQQINDFIVNFLNAVIPGKKAQFKTAGDVRRFLVDYRGKFKTGEVKIDNKTGKIEGKTLSKASLKGLSDLVIDYKQKPGEADVEALTNQYQAAGRDALKRWAASQPTTVPLNLSNPAINSEVTSLLNQEFDSFTKNFDPTLSEATTYINNIAKRVGPKIVNFAVEGQQDQSLDSPQAQQVADIITEPDASTQVTPTIEIFDFLKKTNPNFDSKTLEKDFTKALEANAKKEGIDLSDPNLTPKQRAKITPYNILAEAIGINTKKISQPNANLAKDAKIVQRVLLDAKQFFKNTVLDKAYTDVQNVPVLRNGKQVIDKKTGKPKMVKIGGTTLGYGQNLLNEFFTEPKRLGSGKYVRSPKKWDNKKFDKAIGVKEGKIDPNYKVRKAEDQMMKAMLKAMAEQMSGRATSKIIPIDSRAQAELDAMKSPRVFSKSKLQEHSKKHEFDAYIPYEGEVDADGVYKNTKQYFNDIKRLLESKEFEPGLINKSIVLNRNFFGSSKTRTETQQKSYDWLSKKLDGIKALKKRDISKYGKTKASDLIKYDSKDGGFSGSFNDIIAWFADPKNDIQAYNKKNSAMFNDFWNGINKLLNSPNGKELAPAIYWMLNSTTLERSHPHALAEVVSYNMFAHPTDQVEWEHAVQSTYAYNFLFDAALNPKVDFSKALTALKKNYKIVGFTKAQNQLITDAGYKNNMPKINGKEFDIYKDSWIERYNKTPGLDLTSQDWVVKSPNPFGKTSKLYSKAKNKETKVLKDGQKFKDSKRGKKIIEQNKEIESQDLSKGFNDIIEVNKGLPSKARYSGIMAKRKGMEKGKYRFFIPPSAEDFKGLLYNFLGKGKIGETQMKWFQEKLIDPYNQGVAQMERYRRALKGDYATLLKESPNVRKQLGKKIKGIDFTYDNAVRAYLWNKDGIEIPGLSKRDTKALVDAIAKNPEMKAFAEGLQLISKKPNWIKPTASWDVQSITSDIHNFTSREGRKEYLGEFIDNANQIFSKDNLNKIEGVYGTNVKEALQDALYRMETGINRPSGTNRLTNNFNNWVNRSIGAIMFFNRKSALLQTLSSVNFVNWSDNNPIKAAAAFANQKQYWSDVVKIFNSPKLKSRRAGLKGDINESELASAAANATNKAEAALSYLLKIGFTPTQLADSFAIATGGAPFLRNRINTYKKQGMSEVEADKQAWKDFSAISEETQQSADPSLISQQQASPLGRLILAFQNTPMQYTRLMKKAGQDLINGRGDAKTHISKIIYYGAVQNFIFASLQNALFALIPGFSGEDDEEEESKKEMVQNRKNIRIANNMVDTVLRGSGVYGAIGATLKNTIMKYYENEGKDPFAKDNASILLEAVNLSPPIGSKLRKLNNALKTKEFEKDVISERGWEMTRNGRINLSPSYRVLGSTLEAGLNIPLERTLAEIDAIMEMTDQRNSAMERIALGLGWRTWDIGVPNEEHDQIKVEAKEKKKQARKDKVISDREEKKRLEEERKYLGKTEEEIKLIKEKDSIFDTNKSAQIISLTNLGLTKKEIRELKLEEDRVDKILELTN